MLVVGLASGAMWVGILPSPFSGPINSPEPTTSTATVPCPPDDATFVALEDITVNVLNGTSRAGLAATTSDALTNPGGTAAEGSNAQRGDAGPAARQTGDNGLP